ncbi:MAG: proline--tRNA ligase [Phycisphaerales bacterium]|nr:proline--tRNA ligase [Phycisphaerales bacterium]
MLWTKYFIPTVKETPSDAVVPSHQLGIRAGLFRQVAAGSYTYLPLGYRVLRKIESIIREELAAAGAIELHMPAMHPRSLWEQTGRVEAMGDVLLGIRGNDWQANVVLGPTHEEVITDLVRASINSYKQLPVNLYQIQTKFRGEERPKSGVLRTREFLMKDAYSFHASLECLDETYQRMYATYCRIFGRCGLPFLAVEAEAGPIGGDASHEFMVLTDAGEDIVAIAEGGKYAANIEKAARQIIRHTIEPKSAMFDSIEMVHTPDCKSIEDVCSFLKVEPAAMLKTMVYQVTPPDESEQGGKVRLVIACVRGDHEVNENKLQKLCGPGKLDLCDPTLAAEAGFTIGYVGPHQANEVECTLVIDSDARSVANAVTGANRPDYHVRGFNWARDMAAERISQALVGDIRNVAEGDLAPDGSGCRLTFRKAIEIGHVFKLGCKYSEALSATYLDESGKARPFIMGCYGIGLNRILAAAIEAHHDADGIRWPLSIAPFHVLIVALDVRDEQVMATARQLHDVLTERGIDVLLDDRDSRAGVKFKDADLIGIPIRVTVGKKTLAEGQVELKMRTGGELEKIAPDAAIAEIAERVGASRPSLT